MLQQNMVQLPNILSVHVVWKGRKFVLEQSPDASLKELGEELQALTDVKADTLRLIIPQSSSKSSKLFMPFSEEHSCIKLQDAGIAEVQSHNFSLTQLFFSYVYRQVSVGCIDPLHGSIRDNQIC